MTQLTTITTPDKISSQAQATDTSISVDIDIDITVKWNAEYSKASEIDHLPSLRTMQSFGSSPRLVLQPDGSYKTIKHDFDALEDLGVYIPPSYSDAMLSSATQSLKKLCENEKEVDAKMILELLEKLGISKDDVCLDDSMFFSDRMDLNTKTPYTQEKFLSKEVVDLFLSKV
jgi:hypothetical protein